MQFGQLKLAGKLKICLSSHSCRRRQGGPVVKEATAAHLLQMLSGRSCWKLSSGKCRLCRCEFLMLLSSRTCGIKSCIVTYYQCLDRQELTQLVCWYNYVNIEGFDSNFTTIQLYNGFQGFLSVPLSFQLTDQTRGNLKKAASSLKL